MATRHGFRRSWQRTLEVRRSGKHISAPGQFLAYDLRLGDYGVQFAHGHMAPAPAEATVGVDEDFLGRSVVQHRTQALRKICGGLRVERFDIDDANT